MGKLLSKSKSNYTVYIWLPDGSRVGHASLQLADGTYISWWPENEKKFRLKVPGITNALQDDKRIEGEPDYTLCFPPDIKLDQKAVKTWWKGFKVKGTWNLFTNCCWVVVEALKAGGISEYVNTDEMTIATPPELLDMLQSIHGIDVITGKSFESGQKPFWRWVCGAKKVIEGSIMWIIQQVRGWREWIVSERDDMLSVVRKLQ